ncbi:AraC family transcriptional regulator [Tropicimonas aquimaris]|uniref:GyrI-like domain-containing protein n=1 Tax=Tropicimonas aquimaris TaxID=914152 RepID=A0ABW3IQU9_9RHOB
MNEVDITTHPDRRLAAVAHSGPYDQIGPAYDTLSTLAEARNLVPEVKSMIGIFYDDPDSTPAAELRSHAAFEVGPETPIDAPLEQIELHGGKVAVYRLKGPYSGLKAVYHYLYGTWLPDSGEEPQDAPSYEIYRNMPGNTAPEDLITDICIPLA